MATWLAFYPFVLPSAPSAPDPVLDQVLLGAAREFYERTRLWRPWLSVTTAGTTREYTLPLPAESSVVRLEQSATLNGQPFNVLKADALGVDLAVQEGAERGVVLKLADTTKVQLSRAEADGSVLRVQVALMPSETATGVLDPDWEQYCRLIAEGAKAELLAQRDKPWTDPGAASLARAKFEAGLSDGAWRRHLGGGSTVPRRRLQMH